MRQVGEVIDAEYAPLVPVSVVLTRSSLLSFTTTFYSLLPRELRDLVYHHLLFIDEFWETVSIDEYPGCITDIDQDPSRPRYVLPGMVHREVARELTLAFYSLGGTFSVAHPGLIPGLLAHDFFGTGAAPRDGVLREVSIEGSLTPGNANYVDPDALAAQLVPLFVPEQRWTPRFIVRVHLHVDVYFTAEGRLIADEPARRTHAVMRAFKAVIDDADGMDLWQASPQPLGGSKRRGMMWISVRLNSQDWPRYGKPIGMGFPYFARTVRVNPQIMEFTEEQWVERMEAFVQPTT